MRGKLLTWQTINGIKYSKSSCYSVLLMGTNAKVKDFYIGLDIEGYKKDDFIKYIDKKYTKTYYTIDPNNVLVKNFMNFNNICTNFPKFVIKDVNKESLKELENYIDNTIKPQYAKDLM